MKINTMEWSRKLAGLIEHPLKVPEQGEEKLTISQMWIKKITITSRTFHCKLKILNPGNQEGLVKVTPSQVEDISQIKGQLS